MNRKTLIAAAFACALAAGVVHAQGSAAAPATATALPPPLETLVTELTLSDAQRAEVRDILVRQRSERGARQQAIRDQHRAELAAVLSPDQVTAVMAVREAMRGGGHGHGRGRNGKGRGDPANCPRMGGGQQPG
jgi:Spy/CpxP family protein refolding chaperone